MFKNILKSIAWCLLYIISFFIAALIIGCCVVAFAVLCEGKVGFNTLMENWDTFFYNMEAPLYIVSALIVIIVFVVYKIIRKKPFNFKKIKGKEAIFSASLAVFLNVIITVSIDLFLALFPTEIVTQLQDTTQEPPLFLYFLSVGLLVPIMEEIVFRHGIHSVISRSNLIAGYIISSIGFGVAHGNIIQFLYTATLGFTMAMFFSNTDNIWYPFIMHISFNSLTVFSSTLIPKHLYYFVFGIVSVLCIIIMLVKYQNVRDLFGLEKNPFYVPKSQKNVFSSVSQYNYPVYGRYGQPMQNPYISMRQHQQHAVPSFDYPHNMSSPNHNSAYGYSHCPIQRPQSIYNHMPACPPYQQNFSQQPHAFNQQNLPKQ